MTVSPAPRGFSPATALTLEAVNQMDQAAFTAALGFAFELSPWVVERAHAAGPFASRAALHQAMIAVLKAAPQADKLALIRAHPELAGKAAIAKTLTAESLSEQASAGLDQLTPEEYQRFHALNDAYGARFGFPFIICARLNDKGSILAAMEARLANDPDDEITEALTQIGLISWLRLEDAVADADAAPIPPGGLPALAEAVRRDLELLDLHGPSWVRSRQGAHDVVIVGGGQSGMGAAFGLMRERVRDILVLDENPAGFEGPWATYARMITLRTPKELTAIDFGMPNLTFRAWWEAQYGQAGWAALDKIPRDQWMAYLRWYRAVLEIPLRNDAKVTAIEPQPDGLFRLTLAAGEAVTARKVVLATGIQGGGEWHAPGFITQAIPRTRWAHTSEAIDFEALVGKRVAILGGGASAFDNAQHGLKAGVAQVHVFVRRQALPQVNPIRFMEAVGFSRHFANFDDATKYAVIDSFLERNQPPTNDTFTRAAAYPGFKLHLGSPWLKVEDGPAGVTLTTPKGQFEYDFLILSTGFKTDAALRPELASVAADIALWKDRHQPAGRANPLLDDHPYLGPGFEFQARTPEGAARLHGLFAFNYSALASLGLSASALSGMKFALPKLVHAITRQLFLDDQDRILADFHAYDQPEFVSG
jgi:OHCU decarboxylase